MSSRQDEVLARLALDRDLITLDQLSQARVKQRALREEEGLEEDIARVLVAIGALSQEDAYDLLLSAEMQEGEVRRSSRRAEPQPVVAVAPPSQGRIPTLKLPPQQRRDPKKFIGPYEILERVGTGAMGEVYKTRKEGADGLFAVKALSPSKASEEFVARFKREVEVASRLNHPNLVRCVEHGHDPWRKVHYYVMHFVDGETLRARVERTGRLSEHEALATARQIAMALRHAYENALVHRDVKPQNVMLTSTGRVKLLDLGLARPVAHTGADITVAGSFAGSPYYASPEQARGETDIDVRSDVYSLGATLYYMVTGEAPFAGGTVADVLAGHMSGHIPWPGEAAPEVSERTSRIIAKAMAKDPAERYQTPVEFSLDLDIILQGIDPVIAKKSPSDSTVAPPGSRGARPAKPHAKARPRRVPSSTPRDATTRKAAEGRPPAEGRPRDAERRSRPISRPAPGHAAAGRAAVRRPSSRAPEPSERRAGESPKHAARPDSVRARRQETAAGTTGSGRHRKPAMGEPAERVTGPGSSRVEDSAPPVDRAPAPSAAGAEMAALGEGAPADARKARDDLAFAARYGAAFAADFKLYECGPALVLYGVLLMGGLLSVAALSAVHAPRSEFLMGIVATQASPPGPERPQPAEAPQAAVSEPGTPPKGAEPRRPLPSTAEARPDGTELGGHEYRLIRKGVSWDHAKAFCDVRGGHLVTISSKEENAFVSRLGRGSTPLWIGLTDEREEGKFEWVTGEPLTFTAWNRGEPNDYGGGEDRVQLWEAGTWNDAKDDRPLRFICEWDGPATEPPPCGLAAEYFADIEFKKGVLERVDERIDFGWGRKSPAPGTVPADNFSARWQGYLWPAKPGEYVFTTSCDDNAMLWIDGRLVINDWPAPHTEKATHAKPIRLEAGRFYGLKLEFREFTGFAVIRLQWAGPGFERQAIPPENLYRSKPARAEERF